MVGSHSDGIGVTDLVLSNPPRFLLKGLNLEYNDTKQEQESIEQKTEATYRYSLTGIKPGIWSIGPLTLGAGVSVPLQRLEVGTDFVEVSEDAALEAYLFPRVAYVGQPISYYLRHRSKRKPLSVIWDLPPFEPLITLSMVRPEEEQKAVADSSGTAFSPPMRCP